MRGVFHDEKWEIVLQPKIEHVHDMGMSQTNGARFIQETPHIPVLKPSIEHFDRRQCFMARVLTQIHIGKTSSSNETDEAIIPELLSYEMSSHTPPTWSTCIC